MKKVVRILGIVLAVVLVGIGGTLAYVKFVLPDVGDAPDLKVDATAAQIERGRYLANHVNVCMDCHSTRDWSRFAGPPIAGTLGKGGDRFGPEMGFPGTFYARNITPAGIGQWTDGEIFRAITSGVNRENKPIFPVMPHPNYGHMDQEDVKALVAYVRSLQPITNEVPASEADFPMNFILNTIPQKPDFQKRPDTTAALEYGKYLVNAAACGDCHTKVEQGKPIEGMAFAGGREFGMPGAMVRSANITSDAETGIGNWTKEAFLARFKAYDPAHGYVPPVVKPGEKQSIMPWSMYAGMTENDLGAIYTYLKTIKPVRNKVVTFEVTPPANEPLAAK
ncbi:cytochrome c [Fibrisoma montanum]|uniref:Cytochrome c n=1 Tax=Fibrisoma montanum TaxID=2305895 RepID=A0A418M2R0_9BACT|nr:cytochrome c [Fibrisoma montanum]RIV19850.1 cytochrome c [Fibrisoma montanum]